MDFPRDIGQTEIAAAIMIGELFVMKPKKRE
jgi:hypothetical protein